MYELANLFYPSPLYTILYIALAFIMGFIAGYLLRSGIIAQHKKRILNLEEEMLANHSRILELEKQITDLKNDKLIVNGKQPLTAKTGSKAS
jgi:hypothetical protein